MQDLQQTVPPASTIMLKMEFVFQVALLEVMLIFQQCHAYSAILDVPHAFITKNTVLPATMLTISIAINVSLNVQMVFMDKTKSVNLASFLVYVAKTSPFVFPVKSTS